MKRLVGENAEEKRVGNDPYLADLLSHYGLSALAEKVISENISTIQELISLDRNKLETFPYGNRVKDEIMEFVESIDLDVAHKLHPTRAFTNIPFDDRLITLADTPPRKDNLNLLPIFSANKIEYFSENELNPAYRGDCRIIDLPLSSRAKRYLNAMGFTTLGKLLLTPYSALLEYRYFKNSDLKEVQKAITSCLLEQASDTDHVPEIPRSDCVSKSVTHTHKTPNALPPSSPFPQPSSREQYGHVQGFATEELKPKARVQKCADCEKLLWVLQKMLFDNVSRLGLVHFMGMINSSCRENCTEHGLSAPVIDRGFVARLLARHRDLYVIKGNDVVSKESLKSAGKNQLDRLPGQHPEPAPTKKPINPIVPVVGKVCIHPIHGVGAGFRPNIDTPVWGTPLDLLCLSEEYYDLLQEFRIETIEQLAERMHRLEKDSRFAPDIQFEIRTRLDEWLSHSRELTQDTFAEDDRLVQGESALLLLDEEPYAEMSQWSEIPLDTSPHSPFGAGMQDGSVLRDARCYRCETLSETLQALIEGREQLSFHFAIKSISRACEAECVYFDTIDTQWLENHIEAHLGRFDDSWVLKDGIISLLDKPSIRPGRRAGKNIAPNIIGPHISTPDESNDQFQSDTPGELQANQDRSDYDPFSIRKRKRPKINL